MAEITHTATDGETLSAGALLAQARMAQHLSVEQVARYLRLSESVVRALENDSPSNEIPATYFRGYLRAYAKLLNIEIDAPTAKVVTSVSHSDNTIVGIQNLQSLPQRYVKARTWSSKSVLMIAILAVLGAVGFYAWRSGFSLPSFTGATIDVASDKKIAASNKASNDAVRGELALNLPADQSPSLGELPTVADNATTDATAAPLVSEASAKTDVKNVAPTSETKADAKPSVNAIRTTAIDVSRGGETLEFVFVEDCWVRVTDAQGEVLAVGIKRTGQRFVVAGPAPIKIDLGNPIGVQLKHNNRAVDLSVYPSGRPARLTIDATKFE